VAKVAAPMELMPTRMRLSQPALMRKGQLIRTFGSKSISSPEILPSSADTARAPLRMTEKPASPSSH